MVVTLYPEALGLGWIANSTSYRLWAFELFVFFKTYIPNCKVGIK